MIKNSDWDNVFLVRLNQLGTAEKGDSTWSRSDKKEAYNIIPEEIRN